MLTKASTLLLEQLGDPTQPGAWEEFDARYRPVVTSFARRLGLQDHDAEEAAQATLVRFLEHYRRGQFDRSRGRPRSWIFSIAQSCVRELQRSRARRREWRGESAIGLLPEEGRLDEIWEEEWRAAVTRAALEELRHATQSDPQTVRAFEMLTFEERPAREVAATLEMSLNAVYIAKHRSIQRLRTIMAELQEAF